MKSITVSAARAKLYKLIDEAAASHKPMRIAGKRNNAVLISAEDWASVEETLFLVSIPGMRKSIMDGLKTPPEKCFKELKW